MVGHADSELGKDTALLQFGARVLAYAHGHMSRRRRQYMAGFANSRQPERFSHLFKFLTVRLFSTSKNDIHGKAAQLAHVERARVFPVVRVCALLSISILCNIYVRLTHVASDRLNVRQCATRQLGQLEPCAAQPGWYAQTDPRATPDAAVPPAAMSGDLSRTASENEFNNIMSDLSIEDIEENLRQQQLKQYETIQKQVMQSLEEPHTQEEHDRAIAMMRQMRIKIAELKGPTAQQEKETPEPMQGAKGTKKSKSKSRGKKSKPTRAEAREAARLERLQREQEEEEAAALAAEEEEAARFTAAEAEAEAEAEPLEEQFELPEGWRSHEERSSGNIYYHHKETKTTQWDRPTLGGFDPETLLLTRPAESQPGDRIVAIGPDDSEFEVVIPEGVEEDGDFELDWSQGMALGIGRLETDEEVAPLALNFASEEEQKPKQQAEVETEESEEDDDLGEEDNDFGEEDDDFGEEDDDVGEEDDDFGEDDQLASPSNRHSTPLQPTASHNRAHEVPKRSPRRESSPPGERENVDPSPRADADAEAEAEAGHGPEPERSFSKSRSSTTNTTTSHEHSYTPLKPEGVTRRAIPVNAVHARAQSLLEVSHQRSPRRSPRSPASTPVYSSPRPVVEVTHRTTATVSAVPSSRRTPGEVLQSPRLNADYGGRVPASPSRSTYVPSHSAAYTPAATVSFSHTLEQDDDGVPIVDRLKGFAPAPAATLSTTLASPRMQELQQLEADLTDLMRTSSDPKEYADAETILSEIKDQITSEVSPLQAWVLADAVMREGHVLTSPIVRYLRQGEVLDVIEVKFRGGKHARVHTPQGWASVHSQSGNQLLHVAEHGSPAPTMTDEHHLWFEPQYPPEAVMAI